MKEIERHSILEFYKEKNKNVQKDYVNYLLAYLCMPTLMKLKPSSVIHIDKKSILNRRALLETISVEISFFDCRAFILYEDKSMIILMIYQAELLIKILSMKENEHFLSVYGYSPGKASEGKVTVEKASVGKALLVLRRRYADYKKYRTDNDELRKEKFEYPHEIGLFLGYPIRDVQDFIKYEGKNYLVCGYWKVYHDVDKAVAIFERYHRIRDNAIRGIISGKQLKDILDMN